VTVEDVLSMVSLNVSFCMFLNQNNRRLWNELVGRIMHVRLNDQTDVFIWNLHQNGQYTALMEIKIFMWYLKREVVPTKDNLARQN
jgi:hypothetical protein